MLCGVSHCAHTCADCVLSPHEPGPADFFKHHHLEKRAYADGWRGTNARHTQLLFAVLLVTFWLPRSLSHSITSIQCVLVPCACGPLNVASRHAPVFVRRCRRRYG